MVGYRFKSQMVYHVLFVVYNFYMYFFTDVVLLCGSGLGLESQSMVLLYLDCENASSIEMSQVKTQLIHRPTWNWCKQSFWQEKTCIF